MLGRRGRRGFTIVEVIVSLGVLTIGIAALAKLFTVTTSGTKWNRDAAVARELGRQRIEEITTQGAPPACIVSSGCRATAQDFTAELGDDGSGFQCTQHIDGPEIVDPAGAASNLRYRVDTAVQAHPDGVRYPNANIITLSVCWRDSGGAVRQFQTQRLVIPGV